MSGIELFTPSYQGTVTKTTSTSSAATALNGKGIQVRMYNADATNIVFVEFGSSTIAAAVATGMPIGPGQVVGCSIDSAVTHIATIAGAATPTIYITRGNGT